MSPLDELGDEYLFSAHMVQHMILEFIGPVMLIAALPEAMVRSWIKIPMIKLAERILGNPFVALTVATIVMLVWHIPPIYDITLENETVHRTHHIHGVRHDALVACIQADSRGTSEADGSHRLLNRRGLPGINSRHDLHDV
jgi:cytochrome c oxidase assembly factor CtaG